jgi:adenine C2-methylase RlmN of 23S rRNA A2503 and tRNA A37
MATYQQASSSTRCLAYQIAKGLNRIVLMGMGEPLDNLKVVNKTLEILTADWGLRLR